MSSPRLTTVPLPPAKGKSIGTMKLGKIPGPQLVRIQRPLPSWARAAGAPLRPVMIWRSGRMPVPHDAPAAVVGFQIGRRGQKLGHFRLNRLNQKRPRAIAQNLGQPVGQGSS